MPKIRRVRIANLQYNKRSLLIPDEIWDCGPDSVCTIFLLENGKGKSTIIQAILQPIIPRVKIADRPIENFFMYPTDHAYIILEWQLDNSDMLLMTGISIAASSNLDADGKNNARVKYYTFLSTYPADSDRVDTLVNLPLTWKDENGRFVAAPFDEVRNLSKKVSTLERYTSDDNVRWRERLAEFGISQEETYITAAINQTEGGIAAYFDKKDVLGSSDLLVNKMFLPSIEMKRRSVINTSEDVSLESMIQAYAKEELSLDKQVSERQILKEYSADMEKAEEAANRLKSKNDEYTGSRQELYGYLDALNAEKKRLEEEKSDLTDKIAALKAEQERIRHEKASSEFYSAEGRFHEAEEQMNNAEAEKENADNRLEQARHRKTVVECAIDAKSIHDCNVKIQALETTISEIENNSDKADKLNQLKYSVKVAASAALEEAIPERDAVTSELADLGKALEEKDRELKELEAQIKEIREEIIRDRAFLQNVIDGNDDMVKALCMGIARRMDNHYGNEDLESWRNRTAEERQQAIDGISACDAKEEEIDKQLDNIPDQLSEANRNKLRLEADCDKINKDIEEYKRHEREIFDLCNRCGIAFETRFTDGPAQYMDSLISMTRAQIKTTEQKKSNVEYALKAIKQGTLHIPAEVLKFLENSSIPYVSVEHYLQEQIHMGILSGDQVVAFLNKYPYAAYGIKIDGNAYEQLLMEAGNQGWLPSVLPVFTDIDIEDMLSGKVTTDIKLLSVFAQDYFGDKETYTEKQEASLENLDKELTRLSSAEEIAVSDAKRLSDFAGKYESTWLDNAEQEHSRIKDEADKAEEAIRQIKESQQALNVEAKQIRDKRNELNNCRIHLESALKTYDALLKGIEKERSLEASVSENEAKQRNLAKDEKRLVNEKESLARAKAEADSKHTRLKQTIDKIQGCLGEVAGAIETEVIEGTYEDLYAQYNELSSSQANDLQKYKDELKVQMSTREGYQRKISRRTSVQPEEYEGMDCSDDDLVLAENEVIVAEKKREEAQNKVASLKAAFGAAQNAFNTASNKLKAYGEPLPKDQVGTDFNRRIDDAEKNISEHNRMIDKLTSSESVITSVINYAGVALDINDRPENVAVVTLESDVQGQYRRIKKLTDELQKEVADGENKLDETLQELIVKYTDPLLPDSVITSLKEMRDMLTNKAKSGDRYHTVAVSLNQSVHMSQLRIRMIDTDLKNHDQMKENLINQCVIQGNLLFNGLHSIASNTKAKIQGTRRQVIILDIPKAVDDNIARASIAEEIDSGLGTLKDVMKNEPNNKNKIDKAAQNIVGNENLVRKYMGMEKIQVRAFKVDVNPELSEYRTWESSKLDNSGAQKTIVLFTIVFALMTYSRNSIGEVNENRTTFMPLDNPFGALSSEVMVKPWYDIAQKYNVQLLCFTDIKNVDIVKQFDNVIRLKSVQRKASAKSIVTHDGNELIEHGFYRTDRQTHMF